MWADALSRNHLPLFHSLHSQANQEGTLVSKSLLDLLILSKPDWTSKHWTELWSTTFGTDWHLQPRKLTIQQKRYLQFCKDKSLFPLPASEKQ